MNEVYPSFLMEDTFLRTFMMPATSSMGDISNNSTSYNNKLYGAEEGFLKANMMRNEYMPYKNMTYIEPSITNEREKELFEIQKYAFAAHDLNLYLDVNPGDKDLINLFNKYNEKANELTANYERKYGALNLSDSNGLNKTPWSWIDNPWPWNM